jgi:hypothetical protein
VLRHNVVVDELASIMRKAGMTIMVEPRRVGLPRRASHRRPDIVIYGGHETTLVDVSLLHPLAPSYRARLRRGDSARRELRLIQHREQVKRTRYAMLAQQYDAGRVAPFVVDAFGAFGECAEELLRMVATHAAGNSVCNSADSFVTEAAARIAVAVQNGNAKLQEEAFKNIRAAAGARVRV